MIAHIVKLVPPSDRGMTLVISALPPLHNSKGNSLSGGVKYMGWENLRFLTEMLFILEPVRDRRRRRRRRFRIDTEYEIGT